MEVFVVIRRGVFRKELAGVFTTADLATSAAKALAVQERDESHIYEISEAIPDQPATLDDTYCLKEAPVVLTVRVVVGGVVVEDAERVRR